MKHVWCDKHQHSSHRHNPNTPLNISQLQSPNIHTHATHLHQSHRQTSTQPSHTHTHTIDPTPTTPKHKPRTLAYTRTQNFTHLSATTCTKTHGTYTHEQSYIKDSQTQPSNPSIHTHTTFHIPFRYYMHQNAWDCHTMQLIMKLI